MGTQFTYNLSQWKLPVSVREATFAWGFLILTLVFGVWFEAIGLKWPAACAPNDRIPAEEFSRIIRDFSEQSGGYAKEGAGIRGSFDRMIGEWIGTFDQTTDKVKTPTKYFHAVASQTGPDSYQTVFKYYKVGSKDQKTCGCRVVEYGDKDRP
jgi:hypothetical protein